MNTPPTSPRVAAGRRPPSSRRKAASAVVRTVAASTLAALVQVLSGMPSVANLLTAAPPAAASAAADGRDTGACAPGPDGDAPDRDIVAFANGHSAIGESRCAEATQCATCRNSPRPAIPRCGD